jgi:protein-S-isoprenylcysteine O-methyltransferase Ste14
MTTFGRIRYAIALLLLLTGPGAVLFWFPIHPLAGFWRRVGARWGYATGIGVYAVSAAVLTTYRHRLLSVEFGASAVTTVLGVAFLGTQVWLRRRWRQQLATKTLLGLPELAPDRSPGVLLTEGVYARVRHPRYLQIIFGLTGYACLSNYLAAYGATVFVALAIVALIPLEERELAERFGAAYQEYRRRVPALIPRFRKI